MGFLANTSTILSIFAIFLIVAPSTNSMDATFHKSLESFSQNLFGELVKSHGDKNIIYSPFSIQTCLAMVRMGADGETATEMDHGLGFTGQTTKSIADSYHSVLASFENSDLVTLANKIYLMYNIELQDNFKDILNTNFFSSAESINFAHSKEAANTINNWVESKTNHLIKDLAEPDSFNGLTRSVLLNAIHFKGNWLNPFSEEETFTTDFYTDKHNTVKVSMMHQYNSFDYGSFADLDATAVRLPYKNSDLSMLIFLPKTRTGLAAMQEKLMAMELQTLTQKMSPISLFVELPKFRTEFAIELTDTLKNLGMRHMFENADFGKMLKTPENVSVSKVMHKAIIEVNEHGTEAAAATMAVIMAFSMPIEFIADHPFYYVIVNADNVALFQGTIVNFDN